MFKPQANHSFQQLSPFPMDNRELCPQNTSLQNEHPPRFQGGSDKTGEQRKGNTNPHNFTGEAQCLKMQRQPNFNTFGQNFSQMSLLSIKRQDQLSGYEQTKRKHIVKEYNAFSQVEYRSQKLVAKIDLNSEPNIKQITSILKVFVIEFENKSSSIVSELYQRMLNNTLPKQKNVKSDLSYKSQQSEKEKELSQLSLVSLQEKPYPNLILNELRSKLNKPKVVKVRHQLKKQHGFQSKKYDLMQQLKKLETHERYNVYKEDYMMKLKKKDKDMYFDISLEEQAFFKKEKLPEIGRLRVMTEDQQLVQFLEEADERKISENVKLNVTKPTFLTEQEKIRYTQKRIVAKSFIRRGYGLNSLRRELTETNCSYRFDQSRYKTICYGMVTETFRKLEQFIEEYVPSFTHRMEKIDIRLIAPYLLNCRDNFPNESSIFLKVMQLTYNVDATTVVINKKEATKLYQKVQSYYQSRDDYKDKFDYRLMRMQQSKPVPRIPKADNYDYREEDWPQKSEIELLQNYIETPNIAGVRDKYREKYGMGTAYDDCKLIKSRIYKALRAVIRRLKSVSGQHRELTHFVSFINSLNNDRIKRILISPDAAEARVALCKFAIAKHLNLGVAAQVIQLMENCLIAIDRRRGESAEYDDYQF